MTPDPTRDGDPLHAQRYRVICSRDRRFDGQFYTAVRSTGIYCRPSCPARTPAPEQVTFYETAAAAHDAGYRACRRCLPEAVPGSPRWSHGADLAARAMRLIADGTVERAGVGGLADQLGYSTRQLGRLLTAELGVGPLALARAHRAQSARALLVGTDLPITDVAFAAGFASVRQFNDTIATVFAMSPTELRSRRRAAERPHAPGIGPGDARRLVAAAEPGNPSQPGATQQLCDAPAATLSLRLPLRAPADIGGVMVWLAHRALPGVEHADGDSYARALRLPGGPAAVRVWQDSATTMAMTARLSTMADLPTLVARIRRLFDLDADPVAIDAVLSADPQLAPSVAATPGIRLPGAVDAAEMAVRAVVGQQISVAAARTQLSLLVAAAGEPIDLTVDGLRFTHLFPTPAAIADVADTVMVGPRARAVALATLARALADGSLRLGVGDDVDEQRARLTALRGIGPWTAGYLAMRVIGAPDVLLTGDSALRAGARALGIGTDPAALRDWASQHAPWRSYACLHLWRAAATAAPPPPAAPSPPAPPPAPAPAPASPSPRSPS